MKLSSTEKRLRKSAPSRRAGFTLIETMIALGIAAIIGVLVSVKMSQDDRSIRNFLSSTSQTDELLNLRSRIRNNFAYRSSMDLATGQLDPEFAVTRDLTSDNTFSIRVRSRANPDIVGKVQYQSRCIANTSFERPAPGLPTGFCPQMLTCSANERMAITVSIFTREFDTNPSQIITVPSSVRNKTSQMTSAALCVLNATSAPPANISLKTAFERFTSNQRYAWKIENFELWDDIDSPGIEFVN